MLRLPARSVVRGLCACFVILVLKVLEMHERPRRRTPELHLLIEIDVLPYETEIGGREVVHGPGRAVFHEFIHIQRFQVLHVLGKLGAPVLVQRSGLRGRR